MQPEFRADQIVDPLVGAVVAQRYRLVRLLGAGGMGVVYAAEPVAGGNRVAIKMLLAEFVRDKNIGERFLEEGRTIMRLVHPNVVRVFETGTAEDGTPFIVMELLEGETLGAHTAFPPGTAPNPQTTRKLSPAEATQITQGVLAAFGAAHSLGIVHRDLKPDNVFLPANAPPNAAKILDFGVAKVIDAAGGTGTRTRTGMLLGTPGYMSPEQIKNAKAVDHRSDLFSVAVLFYEMLTGGSPFPAANEFAKLVVILNQEAQPIEAVEPTLAQLSPFFRRALAKERDQRFQSAQEMAQALAQATGGPGRPQLAQTDPMRPEHAHLIQQSMAQAPNPNVPAQNRPATLASNPHAPVSEEAPQVSVVNPQSERRGIPRGVAVIMVVAALVAGFLLGYAVAQAS
ncbi:MAG TPA: serine/threonine-protein kinase [Polyangiaceae bacterium]